MLSLYLAELCGRGNAEGDAEETESVKRLFDALPPESRKKAQSRRGRASALTALGELCRIRMMESVGAGYDVAFREHGKPYSPARRDIAFSISHSGSVAVGALLTAESSAKVDDEADAAGGVKSGAGAYVGAYDVFDVGVDVERIDRANTARHERIARRFYTNAECARIESSADRTAEFYIVWTRKEAYLKFTGDGITRPLEDVDTEHLPDGIAVHSRIITVGADDYALSVAFPSGAGGNNCIYKTDAINNIEIHKIYY